MKVKKRQLANIPNLFFTMFLLCLMNAENIIDKCLNSVKLNRLGKEKKNTFYFLILVIKELTDMLRNWHTITDRESPFFCVQSNRDFKYIDTIISIFKYSGFLF